jgi:hypothetical protein
VILAAAILVAAIPFTREGLAGVLWRSHLRRRWALACRHGELANRNDHTPRITKAGFVPSGDLLRVRMPAGGAVPDLGEGYGAGGGVPGSPRTARRP